MSNPQGAGMQNRRENPDPYLCCGHLAGHDGPCAGASSRAGWDIYGLAAMDELRRLYFEGSEGHGPGNIAVVDWEPCEAAICAALIEGANT